METKVTHVVLPDGSAQITIPPFILQVLKVLCASAVGLPYPANLIMGVVCQIFVPTMKAEGAKPCDCQ